MFQVGTPPATQCFGFADWGGVFPVVLHNFREINFVACRARVLQIQPIGDADCVVYMGALLIR